MTPATSPASRWSVRGLLVVAIALVATMLTRPSRAGDPALTWWTLETRHFEIHHPEHLREIAERTAALGEDIHVRLAPALGHRPSTKTQVVITDDTDSANGFAVPVPYNQVHLFVTAPDDMSPLGDYDDWILELLTHEYAHTLHTDQISGVPSVLNAILGKTFVPNQAQPRWVLEGLATWVESTHTTGGRVGSTLFDMYLRADSIENRWLTIDQMCSDPVRWPQGTTRYLYGSHFLAWIANTYGPGVMPAISADYGATLIPFGINRSVRRATGRTYPELYEGFTRDRSAQYAAQVARVSQRGLREGEPFFSAGGVVGYPRFLPDGKRVAFFRQTDDAPAGIYTCDPLSCESPDLFERSNQADSFSVDGAGTWFTSTTPYENTYSFAELFRAEGGARKQRTQGHRVSGPTQSPDGKLLAYVRNARGHRTLVMRSIDGEALGPEVALYSGERFDQVFTPRFSPDGSAIAFSAWRKGGSRDVAWIALRDRRVRWVTQDRATDMQPEWSPDGGSLYFASDRSGISNIYRYDFATSALSQITNVTTGAFQPAVDSRGTKLMFVGYTSRGYDLRTLPLGTPPLEPDALAVNAVRAPHLTHVPKPAMTLHAYSPWPTLRPRAYTFEYAPGRYGGNALTLSMATSDAVGLHGVATSVVADTNAPLPAVTLDYVYRHLPADLLLRASFAPVPRDGYRVGGENLTYDELQWGGTAGISYGIKGEFVDQSIGISVGVSRLEPLLPDAAAKLDPSEATTRRPRDATITLTRMSYRAARTENTLLSPGPSRGYVFSVEGELADKALASHYTHQAVEVSATGFVPVWVRGGHTLMVQTRGAMSAGDHPRRGSYRVGGYDLQSNTFQDGLMDGVFDGLFPLRGYPADVYAGRSYWQSTLEYRAPVAIIDRGVSTLPVYLRRIDALAFVDYGGAFDTLSLDEVQFFDGGLIHIPELHASLGGELWITPTIAYVASPIVRVGYAYGFSVEAVAGGHVYVVAAGAF